MNIRRAIPLAVAATLMFAAGCGGDDETTSTTAAASADAAAEDASSGDSGVEGSSDTTVASDVAGSDGSFVDSFAAALLEQQVTDSAEEAACAASGIVTTIGEDRLAELGVTTGVIGAMSDYEFTEDEQSAMLGQIFGCVDIASAIKQDYIDSGLTEEQADCVTDKLDIEALVELARSGPGGSDAASAAQAEEEGAAFAECGVEG